MFGLPYPKILYVAYSKDENHVPERRIVLTAPGIFAYEISTGLDAMREGRWGPELSVERQKACLELFITNRLAGTLDVPMGAETSKWQKLDILP